MSRSHHVKKSWCDVLMWCWGVGLPCPVETRLSMILSLRARVSPCFILILFLSRHCRGIISTVQKKDWHNDNCWPNISTIYESSVKLSSCILRLRFSLKTSCFVTSSCKAVSSEMLNKGMRFAFGYTNCLFTMARTLVGPWSSRHPVRTLLTDHFKLTDKNKHVLARSKAGHRCRQLIACSASVVE